MASFVINGRKPLSGILTPAGNKNAALPMLAASLLTDEPVQLTNVPDIEDVRTMLALLDDLGVTVEQNGHTVTLCARGLRKHQLNRQLCRRARSSVLLAGPLAARHGRARLYPPGGDVIGRRRLDTHFLALGALGIETRFSSAFTLQRRRFRGASVLLDEASVTATENAMMAAALAPGRTTLSNAACEPHIQDLGRLLGKMGARIQGFGTNRIEIQGVRALHGARHAVRPDYIEIASFAAAAAATGGRLTVRDPSDRDALAVIEKAFFRLGVEWTWRRGQLVLPARQRLRVHRDLGGGIPKIEDGTWPAFPSDLMSVAIVLATQADGTVLFFEKLFESRMYFVDRLIEMGAQIVQCDPHRVVIAGPSRLHASHMTSPDIRAGMALLIAALCAKGKSIIENAQMIDRGYERIDERLRSLGADIVRTD
ncbi:MAG: UDP-N-acetylglucosamine 1-carboxyvinyltransferase [Kiritimatiellae bacterium]|nr:UDP-N-acetylglucosamine 1-carboxyvinyltransferase [Kiritimatiellia bacterium]